MSLVTALRSDEALQARTLVEALACQVALRPGQPAFEVIDPRDRNACMTFASLQADAGAVASWLGRQTLPGDRILLPTANERAFIVAFVACAMAGCVAVPIQVPRIKPRLPDLGLGRFLAVIEDCGARLTLIDAAALHTLKTASGDTDALAKFSAVAVQDLLATPVDELLLAERRPSPESLALLQYTSGSTSRPKGVMLTHHALMENQRMIQSAYGITPASVLVSWLPLYHDMGLCNGLLQGIASGTLTVVMPPLLFITQPLLWLQQISRFRHVVSGAPNFAYAHCSARIPADVRAALDLSGWQVAFCGAEPIHPETLDHFAAHFAACGFDKAAFCPSYGLAEATLFVSAARGIRCRPFSATALARGVARPAIGDEAVSRLVSCGHPFGDARVCIVVPDTGRLADEGMIGEIMISTSSAGTGYWHQPEASEETFGRRIEGHEGRHFFHSGDLGFLHDGELYVAGRVKELIIVNGVNVYPQDIEYCAQQVNPVLQTFKAAAFGVQEDDGEKIVLLLEAPEGLGSETENGLRMAVMARVRQELDVVLARVVLVAPGSVPRTSSGKVQRVMCRRLFQEGRFTAVATEAMP